MIKNKIKEVSKYIFARKNYYILEQRLFLNSIIFGLIISVLGSIINLTLSTSWVAVIVPLILAVSLLIIYCFVRYKKSITPFVIPISIVAIISISTVWVFNGGINGSNIMPSLVILILALIIVPDKNKIYITIFYIAINIFILLIQFYRSDLITKFPSETDRWIDNLVTFIYSSVLIFLIIGFISKNYTLEKIRAEESEKKYKLVIENIGEGFGFVNSNEEFLMVNPAAEKIFGVGKGELLGKNLKEFLSEEQYHEIRHQTIIRKNGLSSNYEFELTRPDGKIRNIMITAVHQFDDNESLTGTYGIFRDFTDNKQFELVLKQNEKKLLQLNADKDRFMSILAHDLRSPFTGLLGLSELLAKNIYKYDTVRIEKFANDISKLTRSTYDLLEDLLMWVQSQSGKIVYNPQNVSLYTICVDVFSTLNQNIKDKNMTVCCLNTDDIILFADENLFKTVLRNLISNAIKFTNSGGKISIYAEKNQTEVTISVSDNGIGISPDIIAKLFDFSKVYSTKGTERESGTGLGLLLCKEFVEKHNGKIWVESEVGKGSNFKFTLPTVTNSTVDE
jgi:PAS domain S-box-containing protein